jgi:hypothetical protein
MHESRSYQTRQAHTSNAETAVNFSQNDPGQALAKTSLVSFLPAYTVCTICSSEMVMAATEKYTLLDSSHK